MLRNAVRDRMAAKELAKLTTSDDVALGLSTKAVSFDMFREDLDLSGWHTDRYIRKYGYSTTWVYIAVNKNATSAAQIPIVVINKDLEGQPNSIIKETNPDINPKSVEGRKALSKGRQLLKLLEKPNPFQSQMEFVEDCVISLELSGNVIIEKVDTDLDGRPEELYVLNPANVTPVPDRKKLIREYIHTVNGVEQRLKPSEVVHIKYKNPLSDIWGLSRIQVAQLAIESDRAGAEWNRTFLLKGGWPSGAIETDAEPDDDTYNRTKRQIRNSLSKGKDSAGRILFLTGGLKWKAIAINPKDMDWLNGRRMSRDEIFQIFGMTPAVAGVFTNENTTQRSAGVEQQIKQYYRGTVCALVKRILDAFNRDFVQFFAENFKLVPDLRNVPALQDDVQTEFVRAQALKNLVESGLSLNKALARLYPEVAPEPWGSVFWGSNQLMPIKGPTMPVLETQEPPDQGEPPEDDTEELEHPLDAGIADLRDKVRFLQDKINRDY